MGYKIGFIGTGNMGTAMIKNLAKSGTVAPEGIYIFDIDKGKRNALAAETGVNSAESSLEVADKSDIIILAVKPNILKPVLTELKEKQDSWVRNILLFTMPEEHYFAKKLDYKWVDVPYTNRGVRSDILYKDVI